MDKITGYLTSSKTIFGTLTEITRLKGFLTCNDVLTGSLSIGLLGESYTGEYTVIPKAYNDQVLETQGLNMQNDVTVTKVPYYEVSNPRGGVTIYIAEDTNE